VLIDSDGNARPDVVVTSQDRNIKLFYKNISERSGIRSIATEFLPYWQLLLSAEFVRQKGSLRGARPRAFC
jgi:hypothetical protein